jgi:hypothetical protein
MLIDPVDFRNMKLLWQVVLCVYIALTYFLAVLLDHVSSESGIYYCTLLKTGKRV